MRFILPILVLAGCGIESDIVGNGDSYPLSTPPPIDNPIQEDRIVQVVVPVVDILFVVDNSSSMGNEQQALRTNFPLFLDHFLEAGLDYHIAMVSTDVVRPAHSGKLRTGQGQRFITANTVDAQGVFTEMTNTLGVLIGSIESGRAAAYTALETRRDEPTNVDFLRDDADLHIIFVSDDNDQSGGNPVSHAEFLDWADNLKQGEGQVYMHGIVTPPNPCNGNISGTAYIDYADVTDGITYSICAPDWAPALDALGVQTSGLKSEFFLTRVPVLSPELLLTVQVRAIDENGQELVLDFPVCMAGDEVTDPTCRVVYNPGRNSIVFLDYRPDPLSEVLVTYSIAENYAAEVD